MILIWSIFWSITAKWPECHVAAPPEKLCKMQYWWYSQSVEEITQVCPQWFRDLYGNNCALFKSTQWNEVTTVVQHFFNSPSFGKFNCSRFCAATFLPAGGRRRWCVTLIPLIFTYFKCDAVNRKICIVVHSVLIIREDKQDFSSYTVCSMLKHRKTCSY